MKFNKDYNKPICDFETWLEIYPAESLAEVPIIIPTWAQIDEIIYTESSIDQLLTKDEKTEMINRIHNCLEEDFEDEINKKVGEPDSVRCIKL